jgi:ParB family transcriptional regulator, chromosome partitioning protein
MLSINYRKPGDLIPYINNSRTHSDNQVQQVASSIKEFGFTNPILIDEGDGIIAGHGRLMAAQKLGLDEVPTITLKGLTEAQRKAYVIADNQLALNAGWDIDSLNLEIEALTELDFDVSLLGFDDDFMDLLDPTEVDLGLTPEEKLENYLGGDTKILRLAYSEEELSVVVGLLDKGLEATGATDYSTLVYGILRSGAGKW